MPPTTRLLNAIEDAVVKKNAKEGNRRHLGASVIGKECAREIWYGFRWAIKGQFDGRVLRLFNRGHREEPNFVRLFRDAGATVFQAGEYGDKSEIEAFRVSGVDGHFGGTPDAVLDNLPDQPTPDAGLGEFKTAGDKSFEKFKTEGLMAANWVYFMQMQIYMDFHNLPWGLFAMVNKNDDNLHLEYVARNPVIARDGMGRAERIIYATEPPERINESAGFWKCRYCDYKNICHHNDAPEINCRTCAFAAVGPAGSWVCTKGQPEIAGQLGCAEHIYDPRFFDRWTILGGDEAWIEVRTEKGRVFKWGPRFMTSEEFKADCEVPF